MITLACFGASPPVRGPSEGASELLPLSAYYGSAHLTDGNLHLEKTGGQEAGREEKEARGTCTSEASFKTRS